MPVDRSPDRCRGKCFILHPVAVNIDPHPALFCCLFLLRLKGIRDQDRVEIQLATLHGGLQLQGLKASHFTRARHTNTGQAALLDHESPLLSAPRELSAPDIERFKKRQHLHTSLTQHYTPLSFQATPFRTEPRLHPTTDLSGLRLHHRIIKQRNKVLDGRLWNGERHTSLLRGGEGTLNRPLKHPNSSPNTKTDIPQ